MKTLLLLFLSCLTAVAAASKSGQIVFNQNTTQVSTNDLLFNRTNKTLTVNGPGVFESVSTGRGGTNTGALELHPTNSTGAVVFTVPNNMSTSNVFVFSSSGWTVGQVWTVHSVIGNVVTLTNASAGGGIVPPWTNNAGVLQPVSTNAFFVTPNGSLVEGTNSLEWATIPFGDVQAAILSMRKTNEGVGNGYNIGVFHDIASGNFADGYLAVPDDASEVEFGWEHVDGGIYSALYGSLPSGYLQFDLGPTTMWKLEPTAADGTTPYTFDTSLFHTSGWLHEWKNFSTNKAGVTHSGHIISPSIVFTNAGGSVVGISSLQAAPWNFDIQADDGAGAVGEFEASFDFGYYDIVMIGVLGGTNSQHYFNGSPGVVRTRMISFGETLVDLNPTAADAVTPYLFDTSIAHTSGSLNEWKNLGVTHLTLASTNGISTPLITAYGGTSHPWQFGKVTAGVVTLDTANYVEVAINGVLKKLLIAP